MKKLKKILKCATSLILSVGMVFCPFGGYIPVNKSVTVAYGDDLEYEGFKYEVVHDSYVEIKGYTGSETEVVIPESVAGYTVQGIGNEAFYENENIKIVSIPDGVKSIGENAFEGCVNLCSVVLPNSIKIINRDAFSGCSSLVNINLPKGIVNIGNCAFSGCESLLSVKIPETVTIIDGNPFKNCSGLTNLSVDENNIEFDSRNDCNAIIETGADVLISGCVNTVIPNDVCKIGTSAFSGCEKLENLSIPYSITSIEGNPFEGCSALTSICVDKNNSVFDSRNNCNAIIETDTNVLISGCVNTIIPQNITKIGEFAFYKCDRLTSISIPEKVTKIGDSAFQGCNSLKEIIIPEKTEEVGAGAFCNCTSLGTVNIPVGIISINASTFLNCSSLIEISLPKSLTSINDLAFNGCTNLKSINIPDSVTSIGSGVFNRCENLVIRCNKNSYAYNYALSKGITTECEENTTDEESDTTTIQETTTLQQEVTTKQQETTTTEQETTSKNIANGKCGDNLNWVIDNDGILTISGTGEMYDFKKTSSFDNTTKKTIPWSNYRSQIKSIVVEEGVSSIGDFAFYNTEFKNSEPSKDTIEKVYLPKSLNTIGSSAFYTCNHLSFVEIPDSVYSIGSFAFCGCVSLSIIDLPDELTELGQSAFEDCLNIKQIFFNEKLKKINDKTFDSCINIEKITIPKNIKSIGAYSFCYCEKLKELIIEGDIQLSEYVFKECKALEKIKFNGNISGSCFAVFSNCDSINEVCIPSEYTTESGDMYPTSSLISGSINLEISNITFTDGAKWIDGVLFSSDDKKLLWYPKNLTDTDYNIPNGVEIIGAYSFENQESIKHISIPDSVKTIQSRAFQNCINLDNVIIPEGVSEIYCFQNCKSLQSIIVPSSVERMFQNAKMSIESFYSGTNLTMYCDTGSYAYDFANSYDYITPKNIVYCNFEPTGGNVSVSRYAVIPDDRYWNLPVALRDGYIFDGWYTKEINGNKINTDSIVSENTSFTLYAHWTPEKQGLSEFEWGKDNWKFDNSYAYFKNYNYNVNSYVMDSMCNDFNLTASDKQELKNNIYIDNLEGWGGSCFGMTVSEIYAKQGDLKLSRYGGDDIVNKNTNTSNMISVINFIQEMQTVGDSAQILRQSAFIRGNYMQKDFIKKIESVFSGNKDNIFINISYGISKRNPSTNEISMGYHAVLAYGIEDCNYYSNITGNNYNKKILIADPNYSEQNILFDDACIYYNTNDYSWIVPYWNNNNRSCYCNDGNQKNCNTGIIRSILKYNSLMNKENIMADYEIDHYLAGINIRNYSGNITNVEKVNNTGNSSYDYAGDSGNGVLRYDIDADDTLNISENEEIYALWNPTSNYEINYSKVSDYRATMNYEDIDYYINVNNSYQSLFKPNGYVEVKGSDISYDISLVTDKERSIFDWYLLGVSDESGADSVFVKISKNGYILSSDDLKGIRITASDENKTVVTDLNTDYDNVLIYQKDDDGIGIKIDADDNGIYETELEHKDEIITQNEDETTTQNETTSETETTTKAANTITGKSVYKKTTTTKKQSFKLDIKSVGGTIKYKSNSSKVKVTGSGKVTITKNFVGTAVITVTAGNSDYETVTKKITIKVLPPSTKITTAKNNAKSKITVKWGKVSNVTGYQLQYSTDKSFKMDTKTLLNKKASTTSKVITKLEKGNTYYIRIRTYKNVSGKNVYSAWSAKKKVKINK